MDHNTKTTQWSPPPDPSDANSHSTEEQEEEEPHGVLSPRSQLFVSIAPTKPEHHNRRHGRASSLESTHDLPWNIDAELRNMATITQNNIDLNPITRASLSPVHTVSDTSSSASPSPFPSTSIAVLRSIRSAEPVPSTHSKRFLVRKKSSKVLHNTTDTLHEFQRRKLSLKPQPPPRKGRRPSFGRVPSKPPPSYRRKFVSKSPMPPPPRRKGTSGTQSVDSLPSPRDLPRYVFLRMDSHKVAMYRVSTF